MTRNRTTVVPNDALTGTRETDPLNAEIDLQDKVVVMDSATSLEALRDSLNAHVSLDMDDPTLKGYAELEKFMDEKVLVRVLPSTEKSAEHIVEVWNNGVLQCFPRGQWVICKRRFVEVLARAKPFSVATPEIVDANGDRATRIDTSTALRYPFTMRDTNPRGDAWLNFVLAQA